MYRMGNQPDIGADREPANTGFPLGHTRTEAGKAGGGACRCLGHSSVDPSISVLHDGATAQGKDLKGRLRLWDMGSNVDWLDLKHGIWAVGDGIFGGLGF